MAENNNIWLSGVMGVVAGDALGCPVQFESRKEVARHPITGMRGYGTFHLPEGSWTDDSSLTLADKENLHYYDRLQDLDRFVKNTPAQIKSGGYVVDTLEAAVWSLITTDQFDQALLKVVNLGEDTDTTGAVAGGLAGLYYGYDAIPEEWLKVIKRRDWIEEMCSGGQTPISGE